MFRPTFSRPGRKLWWLLGGVAAALALYTFLGFWVAPRVLRRQLTEFVREEYGRSLSIGEIRVHPFKLYVELKQLALPDADRQTLLGFDRLFLDFQALSSIGHWAYVFREVTLERPVMRVVVRPNGELNLADLAGKPKPEEKEEEELADVWVQTLNVGRGRVSFADRARRRPFEEELTPLSFTLRNFRTTARGGKFTLDAASEDGAKLRWTGSVALSPLFESAGSVSVANVPLPKLAEYLDEQVPFQVARGTLQLRASYRAELGKRLKARAHVQGLALQDVALRARGERVPWVRLGELALRDAEVVLERRSVEVQQLTLSKLVADVRLEPGGGINLSRLLAGKRPAAEEPPKPAAEAPAWSVRLHGAELSSGVVNVEDQAIAPGTKLSFEPVRLEAKELSLELGKPVPVHLRAAFDGGDARFAVRGTVTPEPLSADLELELEGARLALAQPYISQHANLIVRDGSLALRGELKLRPAGGAQPELQFAGGATLEALRTSDPAVQRDFVNAARIDLEGVRYTIAPDALSIAQIRLTKPYARVILSPQQVLNVAAVFAEPQGRSPAPELGASAAKHTNDGAAEPKTAAEPGMPIRIDTVRVDGMRLHFADYFIQPNFAAEIHALHGTLRGLSSDPRSRAAIALKGKLGANSPVEITGKVQAFAYDQLSDLQLRCSNIELAVFNPYSGRFAGYNIARGELATDIHYLVRQRQLTAQHKVRIDQLAWGEETDSKEAAPLPVKLATVLLRDRNGVISLDIPVNGSLDDPKFRLGPIIWQVVKNVIVKAATAPFDLLGSLFQGAEKARYIEFAPGEATLDEAAREGLNALTNAMVERPELRLQVPLGADPELDRAALVERKFQERVRVTMQSALRRREKRDVTSFEQLDADRKSKVLSQLYEEVAGKEPKIAPLPAPAKELSRSEQRAAKSAHELAYLEQATRERIEVEPEELATLGRERAQAIESALLATGKLDHTRILVSQRAKVSSEQGKVRFELGFE